MFDVGEGMTFVHFVGGMLIRVLLQYLALLDESNDVECHRELVLQPHHVIGGGSHHASVVAHTRGRSYENGHEHLWLKD